MGVPTAQFTLPPGWKNAFFPVSQQPAVEGKMCLDDRPEIGGLTGKQEFPGRKAVHDQSQRDLPGYLSTRKIFGQHNEVITEVKKDLPFAALGQSAPSDVVYTGLWTGIHLVPGQLQPPAKIDLFLVRKKIAIQAAQLVIEFRPHEHGRSAGPEYGFRFVVLSLIFFAGVEYPSFGKRIAQMIDPASQRSSTNSKNSRLAHMRIFGWQAPMEGLFSIRVRMGSIQPGSTSTSEFNDMKLVALYLLPAARVVSPRKAIIPIQQDQP